MNELASCSKVITIHGFQSRQPHHSYTHHRGIVNCLSINHNNKVIASCGQDGKIVLVNADKPQEYKLTQYTFYSSTKEKLPSLTSCAFSHNSKYLAAGAMDSVIKVWDLRSAKDKNQNKEGLPIKTHLGGITSLAWIKNKNQGEILASASSSGDIFLTSLKNTNQSTSLKLNQGINCIRVSEADTYCRLAASTSAGSLAIWDLLVSKEKPVWTTSSVNQTKSSITSLAFSSFSPVLLVTASVDQSMVFYDIRQKRSVKVIATEQPLSAVGLHSNGHILSAGGMYGSLFIYDLRNPVKPQNKMVGHETGIKHLQFFKLREKQNNGQVQTKGKSSISIPQAKEQVKETRVEPMQNNFVGKTPIPAATEPKKEVKIEERLSTTAKQLLQKQSHITQPPVSQYSQINHYSHINQQINQHSQNRQNDAPNPSYLDSNGFQRNRSPQDKQLDGLKKEISGLKGSLTKIQSEQKALKGELYDMEERLSMTIVKQFQLQQQQFRRMLQGMQVRERQKDKKIAALQAENHKLKTTTY